MSFGRRVPLTADPPLLLAAVASEGLREEDQRLPTSGTAESFLSSGLPLHWTPTTASHLCLTALTAPTLSLTLHSHPSPVRH